ncbi:hypothetical protein R3P38DRAFT_3068011, partial [Favolaschia claudopus]
ASISPRITRILLATVGILKKATTQGLYHGIQVRQIPVLWLVLCSLFFPSISSYAYVPAFDAIEGSYLVTLLVLLPLSKSHYLCHRRLFARIHTLSKATVLYRK